VCWVEEAQTLTERSLQLLRPSIRKDGSSLWFSFNPRFKRDAVDIFTRQTPPENMVSISINY
jgi:phage terminase large subunit